MAQVNGRGSQCAGSVLMVAGIRVTLNKKELIHKMINISEIISNVGKIVTITVLLLIVAVLIWCTSESGLEWASNLLGL